MAARFELVVAFEPWWHNADRWRRNMVGVENATIVCAALGDEKVKVRLQHEPTSKHFCIKDPDGDVEMLTLDSFGYRNLDFLKVDTEGADTLVLMGAVKTLRRCRPVIIFESISRFEDRYGLPEGAPMKFLEELGAKRVAEIWPDFIYVFPDGA